MPLPFRIRPNGFEISLKNIAGKHVVLTAGFLYRRWFHATDAQGNELPIGYDKYARIEIRNTYDSSLILVRYLPPWWFGICIGLAFLLLAFLAQRLDRGAGLAPREAAE